MNWIKPDWPAAKNIHAAVTLRTGGLSKGAFSSLNPALHVNDKPDNVIRNRQIISEMLNLPAAPVWLEQVHGNRAIKADQLTRAEQADASFSEQAGVVCAVMTADCLPILLATSKGDKIAAIHAGWRGLLAGVIRQTVNALDATNIIAWLGPAIGPDHFEVGSEVKNAYVKKDYNFSVRVAGGISMGRQPQKFFSISKAPEIRGGPPRHCLDIAPVLPAAACSVTTVL